MLIRKATKKDLDAVYKTFLELIKSEDAAAKKIGYMAVRKKRHDFGSVARKQLLQSIRQRKSLYLVAEINNHITGYAYATIFRHKDSFFHTYPIGYLNAIVVRKKYRGQGIASALMKEAEKWFKKKKCIMSTLDVFYTNPAINVYTRLGYHAYDYRMFKRL